MKYLLIAALALFSLPSFAATYDVTAEFTPATTGGPSTGYRLYRGCDNLATKTLIAEVTPGQSVPGALPTQGQHYLCVSAYNSTGESEINEIAAININDFEPVPGAPSNLHVNVSCDTSCNVSVTIQPAP